jgi:hypothetical protein
VFSLLRLEALVLTCNNSPRKFVYIVVVHTFLRFFFFEFGRLCFKPTPTCLGLKRLIVVVVVVLSLTEAICVTFIVISILSDIIFTELFQPNQITSIKCSKRVVHTY